VEKLHKAFKTPGTKEFLVVLPTGCGKTLIMALAPFAANAVQVLVLTPSKMLSRQVCHELDDLFQTNPVHLKGKDPHPLGRVAKDVTFKIGQYARAVGVHHTSDILVTNIHQLVQSQATPEGDREQVLHPTPKEFIREASLDLVIVDEAHHMDAQSWKIVRDEVRHKNPEAKLLFLTATPQRQDGVRPYNITQPDQLYLYKRWDAILAKYIRNTQPICVRLTPKFKSLLESKKGREVHNDPDYIRSMMKPAMKKLQEIRKSCGEKPFRMLVTARTNDDAEELAKQINSLSKAEFDNEFHAEHLTSEVKKAEERASFEKRFSCDEAEPGTKLIDIGVHCQIMAEGYDNKWIIVSTFVAPPASLPKFAQLHGRAIRSDSSLEELYVQSKTAYLFFPDITEVTRLVQEYLDGTDEDEDKILEPPGAFSSIKEAHFKVRKLRSTDAAKLLKENFENYHNLLACKREQWNPDPTERLAQVVFEELIKPETSVCAGRGGGGAGRGGGGAAHRFTCNIIDFGCGRDGYFEVEMARLIQAAPGGRGVVDVLGADVERPRKECTSALNANDGIAPDEDLQFRCSTAVGHYFAIKENRDYQDWLEPAGESPKAVDAAIFCQSLMSEDAIPEGLIVAMETVKPGGVIYIVLDKFKFGMMYQDVVPVETRIMNEWITKFNAICKGIVCATCLNYKSLAGGRIHKRLGKFIFLKLQIDLHANKASVASLTTRLRNPEETTLRTLADFASKDREVYIAEYQSSNRSASSKGSQSTSGGRSAKKRRVDESRK
jgi:superfamily II DNA or RNA helicase